MDENEAALLLGIAEAMEYAGDSETDNAVCRTCIPIRNDRRTLILHATHQGVDAGYWGLMIFTLCALSYRSCASRMRMR